MSVKFNEGTFFLLLLRIYVSFDTNEFKIMVNQANCSRADAVKNATSIHLKLNSRV